LFAAEVDNPAYPSLKTPARGSFVVRNLFADFKRHDLGPAFHERNFDGSVTTMFMTEPLWGVATTAPYGHDGKSINLKAVILRHGGEAQASRQSFEALSDEQEADLLLFLGSLVLFPPDHTASNLDPGNPSSTAYPTRGQGSIKLGALFNDPADPE
jgi:cytochrome c peroxidase